jgi:hypothetical protein
MAGRSAAGGAYLIAGYDDVGQCDLEIVELLRSAPSRCTQKLYRNFKPPFFLA